MRTVMLTAVLMVGAVAAGWAQGAPAAPINVDADGVALHGHDPVAYFVEGKAVPGAAQFEYQWSGATWRFASAANRDAFAKSPATYAPQFGGYCAWAVSRNYTADVDPFAFAVVNGKLYLNYSTLIQARWRLDRDGNIKKGEANWPGLLAQTTAAPAAKTKKGGQ